MPDLTIRLRRFHHTAVLKAKVRETELNQADFIITYHAKEAAQWL